jgi:hypothetical protein
MPAVPVSALPMAAIHLAVCSAIGARSGGDRGKQFSGMQKNQPLRSLLLANLLSLSYSALF